jgi:AmpD protein
VRVAEQMQNPFHIKQGWLDLNLNQQQTNLVENMASGLERNGPLRLDHKASPHFDQRKSAEISLLVIHNISLPPGEFGGEYISDLFLGCLNPNDHPCFADICELRVSAHCLIRRNGEVVQYVPFDQRAWHAGISSFEGREGCNEFSIGIEMEGTDTCPYTDIQYHMLGLVTHAIMKEYPDISPKRIIGHCDIAPGRKTDPGESFDWHFYKKLLNQ